MFIAPGIVEVKEDGFIGEPRDPVEMRVRPGAVFDIENEGMLQSNRRKRKRA